MGDNQARAGHLRPVSRRRFARKSSSDLLRSSDSDSRPSVRRLSQLSNHSRAAARRQAACWRTANGADDDQSNKVASVSQLVEVNEIQRMLDFRCFPSTTADWQNILCDFFIALRGPAFAGFSSKTLCGL